MEYPPPATPRTPYTNSQIPSQYTPSVDEYSQALDDSSTHGPNPHCRANNTSMMNATSQFCQGHNADYDPLPYMPSFETNAQGNDMHMMNPSQQPNNSHNPQSGSLPETYLVAPSTFDRTAPVANLGQQVNGDHNAGHTCPLNTSQRFDLGHQGSLPSVHPNTSQQLDHGHHPRFNYVPTTPSAELGTYGSNVPMTNASQQPYHNRNSSQDASLNLGQKDDHGYCAIQDRSSNTSQHSINGYNAFSNDRPIVSQRRSHSYNALHSIAPNTSQLTNHEHNALHSFTLNTPVGGPLLSGEYEHGGYRVFNTPVADIPIDPALTAISISIDEPLSHRTHPDLLPAMLRAASNPHSRLQRAPLYIRGRVFSLSEQRIIILGRHFLGYTAEHIAPVFGLQDDGSGEPAKGAEVIDAAYEFLRAGRMYQGSTGLWAVADDMVSARLDVRIRAARQKQVRVQMKRIRSKSVPPGHFCGDLHDAKCTAGRPSNWRKVGTT